MKLPDAALRLHASESDSAPGRSQSFKRLWSAFVHSGQLGAALAESGQCLDSKQPRYWAPSRSGAALNRYELATVVEMARARIPEYGARPVCVHVERIRCP